MGAEVPQELRFRPEGESTHSRMDAVGPDHEVEGAHSAAGEGGLGALAIFGERDNAIAEEVFGEGFCGVVEDRAQVAAQTVKDSTSISIPFSNSA